MKVERRGCWDRVLVGNQGNSYCSVVDSPAAAAGLEGAAWVSRAARPWVSALPERWGPLQPAVEVQADCGPGWQCPWCRLRKKGHGALDWSWEVWTSWCSSVDMGRSRPQGRSWGQAASQAVGCSTVLGEDLTPGSWVRTSGQAHSHRWVLFL